MQRLITLLQLLLLMSTGSIAYDLTFTATTMGGYIPFGILTLTPIGTMGLQWMRTLPMFQD